MKNATPRFSIPEPVVAWLLEGPAFVRYRTRLDLLDQPETGAEAVADHRAMLADPNVIRLIAAVNDWEGQYPITRHTDADHPLHKLAFAASLGIKKASLQPAIEAILRHQSPEGPFQVRIRIPKAFGGDDRPKWDWVATDAPLILYALLRLGVKNRHVMKGVDCIRQHVRAFGYPCFASGSMGKFHGPGRKEDPCPYANLIVLRMFSQIPGAADTPESRTAREMLLRHWELQKEKKYYLFGIGTDFRKPKAPLIWYDLLHYLDTLSRFPGIRNDPRLREAAEELRSRAGKEGRFTPESVWTKWKGWEFCQKREPSRWITLVAWRIFRRMADDASRRASGHPNP